ncbi:MULTISPECIES: hypothetical protein [Pseudomonadota]|jgi:hypothetical protein|uniref:hypothetical protein n=1 Tax=Pseudomonadota TaxID=1224 RepID=UPI0022BE6035|nr:MULTISPECIES: hypothetical protein [Pseudomonadota]MCZ8095000.1 hypothetical protein [Acidovorax sp.]MCZ8227674.1 hypothetical protein [Burkholderiaceae bacterium]MCZ8017175.1 hypothetical protein [Limnobacter sp.]MCZ8233298.1 hypothetical protein [Novosphingobium sp.]MCZ8265196.1 hypothetical protein [Novosphingobium sp.]
MPKFEFKWALLATTIVLVGGAFYWFEYRPSVARQECSDQSDRYAVNAFEQGIKNGEWRGSAPEDFSMSKKQLLGKYKGYRNSAVSDKEFEECLRYRGISN